MLHAVIEARNITKTFAIPVGIHNWLRHPHQPRQRLCALNDVTFEVRAGEILGLVGPNGAGKTTLQRILADLLIPDDGEVIVGGRKMNGRTHSNRREIGLVASNERSFFWRLTGRQNLEFFAHLYRVPRRKAKQDVLHMLGRFGLLEKSQQLFRDYSAGTRKKFALIRALLHQPNVILLDEVTNSLDPPAAQEVKSLVRDYVNQGPNRACVWCTHRLEEVSQVCDKVLAIESGRVESLDGVCPNRSWRL